MFKKLFMLFAIFTMTLTTGCANLRRSYTIEVGTGDDVKIGLPTETDYEFQSLLSAFAINHKDGTNVMQGVFYNNDMYDVMKNAAKDSESNEEITNLQDAKKGDYEGFTYTFKYGEEEMFAAVYKISENTMVLFTGKSQEEMTEAIDKIRIDVKVGVRQPEEKLEEATENTEENGEVTPSENTEVEAGNDGK